MTTAKHSQYDKDENKLIEIIENMRERYNINLEDIFSIIKDRF